MSTTRLRPLSDDTSAGVQISCYIGCVIQKQEWESGIYWYHTVRILMCNLTSVDFRGATHCFMFLSCNLVIVGA